MYDTKSPAHLSELARKVTPRSTRTVGHSGYKSPTLIRFPLLPPPQHRWQTVPTQRLPHCYKIGWVSTDHNEYRYEVASSMCVTKEVRLPSLRFVTSRCRKATERRPPIRLSFSNGKTFIPCKRHNLERTRWSIFTSSGPTLNNLVECGNVR